MEPCSGLRIMRASAFKQAFKMLSSEISELLQPVNQFLHCKTPKAWLDIAARPESLPVLLQDHLICELKAALIARLFRSRSTTFFYLYHKISDNHLVIEHATIHTLSTHSQ